MPKSLTQHLEPVKGGRSPCLGVLARVGQDDRELRMAVQNVWIALDRRTGDGDGLVRPPHNPIGAGQRNEIPGESCSGICKCWSVGAILHGSGQLSCPCTKNHLD